MDKNSNSETEYCGYPGAQEITGLAAGTLYSLVSKRRIPHVRIGPRLVRFNREELRNWLRTQEVHPNTNEINEKRGYCGTR